MIKSASTSICVMESNFDNRVEPVFPDYQFREKQSFFMIEKEIYRYRFGYSSDHAIFFINRIKSEIKYINLFCYNITVRKILITLSLATAVAVGWFLSRYYYSPKNPKDAIVLISPRPLDKYTIENLAKRESQGSQIKNEETLSEEQNYTSYLFSFNSEGKKVTGQLNIPKGDGPFPTVVMFRGYVDQEIYKTGVGSSKAASVFAKGGFITIAPDFLGYGGSDRESGDVMEARFQTYTNALDLINSLNSIPEWDKKNIFIWGHSNGGQIALSVLEITGKSYPTTLWAPVSKPFPYSVLYYTDESEDRGKFLRREIAKFEETYDPDLYSIDRYYDRIKAQLQIHQGTADDAVPINWSDELTKKLEKLEADINYYIYPGADHNMQPAWNTVVSRDLTFFRKHLKMN